MKRYLLFGGTCYHPLGGFHDFVCSFDKLRESINFARENSELNGDDGWWHVFDSEHKIIQAEKNEPYNHGHEFCRQLREKDKANKS